MERLSPCDAHLRYRPFTDYRSLLDAFAEDPCDNAPDEKGIRWNRLMYW